MAGGGGGGGTSPHLAMIRPMMAQWDYAITGLTRRYSPLTPAPPRRPTPTARLHPPHPAPFRTPYLPLRCRSIPSGGGGGISAADAAGRADDGDP